MTGDDVYNPSTFKEESKYHYTITLASILDGISIYDVELELKVFESIEEYAICDGIKRALDFCETKTLLEIKREYNDL